jgi:DNA-binding PadR family transcriptional regulator
VVEGRPYVRLLSMADVRMTVAVAQLLREFLTDPAEPRHGYELMQKTGFPSGKLYPLLARLHRAGVLIREWEQVDPREAGRPARCTYRLSPDAAETVRHDLTELSDQLRPAVPQRPLPPSKEFRPRVAGRAA